MSAIDDLFETYRRQGRKALLPFITAGDPDLDFTADVLRELAARGCGPCEVGIPYSDPIADGPVIQESYTRALSQGLRVHQIYEMLTRLAPHIAVPLVTMVSYAIVYRRGVERFVGEAKAAGTEGMIVPDLPVEEADHLAAHCRDADLSLIQLVTPTTPRERAVRIAATSSGFLYYVSVAGITGERRDLPARLTDDVKWLRGQTDLPICVGFGISAPEHVQMLSPVADGLIVGSALVRRIAGVGEKSRQQVICELGDYVTGLLDALAT